MSRTLSVDVSIASDASLEDAEHYTATLDLETGEVTISRPGVAGQGATLRATAEIVGTGKWNGDIYDCPADLGDDVYEALSDALADELAAREPGWPDVDLDLTPITVGFDLRTTGHAIVVPEDASSAAYDVEGERKVVRGSRAEVVGALEAAGYTVLRPGAAPPIGGAQ